MSDSTRYFQLTPNILVEYNYNSLGTIDDMAGKKTEIIDLGNDASIISNGYCATRTFLWKQLEDRFVLPINKAESKFVQCAKKNQYSAEYSYIWSWNTDFGCDYEFTSEGNEDYDDDILSDTFKLHFTSRNYLDEYDGYILTVHIYDKIKNKIVLLSYYSKRTDDPDINPNPVLINQKLYTSSKEFTIPNITAILKSKYLLDKLPAEDILNKKLSPNYGIMENTPVVMTIYGVKSTMVNNNYEYYNVEKINSIYVPIEEKENQFYTVIEEATDGDYFKIYPEVNDGKMSFSDYIYSISDGQPEKYIVFHELTLTEHFVDIMNTTHDVVTHREQYIINAAKHSETEEEKYQTNEGELDDIMYYRPIVVHSGKSVSFTIQVKTNIINTLDNTTIIKCTTLDYPEIDKNTNTPKVGQNPKKYGKRMNQIYLGEAPTKVNVYNKKPNIDIDGGVKIVNNGGSSVKIENHQHSVIGFIECANVGVSIEQVPKEWLQ